MANLGTRPRTPSSATTIATTRRRSAPRPPGVPLCYGLRLAALRPALGSRHCHPPVCRCAVNPSSVQSRTDRRSAVLAKQRQWVRLRGQRRPLAAFFPAFFFPALFFAALRGRLLPFSSAWSCAFLPAFFLPSAAASAATTTVSAGDPDPAACDFLTLALGTPPATAPRPDGI